MLVKIIYLLVKNRFTKMVMLDGGVSIGGGQVSALSGTKIDFTQTEFRIPTISGNGR